MSTYKHLPLIAILGSFPIQAAFATPQIDYHGGTTLYFADSSNVVYTNTGEAYFFYGTFDTLPDSNYTALEIENAFNQLGSSADVTSGHSFSSSVEDTLFESQRGYLIVADNSDIGLADYMAIVSNSSISDWTFNADLSVPILPTPAITPDDLVTTDLNTEIILGNRDTIPGGFETIKLQLVAVPEPSYATWVSLHGLSGDAALEMSNPAGDGISNLMKYALRLDPNELVSAETDGVVPGNPAIIESGEGFKFTFLRNAEASDLTYSVQSCEDLSSWEPVTSGVSETVLSATLVKVAVLLPAGEARFCRLVVTK